VAFLGNLQAAGVDLYLDRQGIDTTTPGGKALFQMMGVFAEFERAMIRERINAGLARARKEGKRLGRPPGASKKRRAKQSQVQELHKQGHSVRQIARQVGIATGTVQTYLKSA
jgi:DNA invertase Pin-like site-specific DNA recombinase